MGECVMIYDDSGILPMGVCDIWIDGGGELVLLRGWGKPVKLEKLG